jgi:hypothetical protein
MSELLRSRVIEALDALRLSTAKANLDRHIRDAQRTRPFGTLGP